MTPIFHTRALRLSAYVCGGSANRFATIFRSSGPCVCACACVEGSGGQRGRMDEPVWPLAGYWSPTKPSVPH